MEYPCVCQPPCNSDCANTHGAGQRWCRLCSWRGVSHTPLSQPSASRPRSSPSPSSPTATGAAWTWVQRRVSSVQSTAIRPGTPLTRSTPYKYLPPTKQFYPSGKNTLLRRNRWGTALEESHALTTRGGAPRTVGRPATTVPLATSRNRAGRKPEFLSRIARRDPGPLSVAEVMNLRVPGRAVPVRGRRGRRVPAGAAAPDPPTLQLASASSTWPVEFG